MTSFELHTEIDRIADKWGGLESWRKQMHQRLEQIETPAQTRALTRYELAVLEIVSRTSLRDRPYRGDMPAVLVERDLVEQESRIHGYWITEAGAEMLERQKPTPLDHSAAVVVSQEGQE